MDLHLGPMQHQATIASKVASDAAATSIKRPGSEPWTREKKIDNGCSWVMLKPNGDIEPLEGENILLKTPDHVSLELRVPQGLRTANSDFSVKCDEGTAYVTNKRVSRRLDIVPELPPLAPVL